MFTSYKREKKNSVVYQRVEESLLCLVLLIEAISHMLAGSSCSSHEIEDSFTHTAEIDGENFHNVMSFRFDFNIFMDKIIEMTQFLFKQWEPRKCLDTLTEASSWQHGALYIANTHV